MNISKFINRQNDDRESVGGSRPGGTSLSSSARRDTRRGAVRKRLGEMLVDAGLLTGDQLEKALPEQRRSGLKLGQYLIMNGILREDVIVDLISEQLRIDKFDSSRHPFDVSLSTAVPQEFAQKHNLVPVCRRGTVLTVATTDPMDINALDSVELISNYEVEPVICTEKELNDLTFSIYGVTNSDLDEAIDRMEDMDIESEFEMESPADIQLDSLHDMAEEAPIVRLVNSILAQAMREGASDIHISPEKDHIQLRFRVDGKLRDVPAPPKSVFLPVISRLKILANMDIAVTRVPQDGRFSFNVDGKEVHVRASALPTIHGENMVLRLLQRSGKVYTMDELGMDAEDVEKLRQVIYKPYGMILATGPTGSGKSTSLYAILREINRPDINIVTLEDPVEYRVERIRQVQLNRKAGMTFAGGLRSILRQDPDVIMVGEIRDTETASISVQSALTGHRLLSTIHTNDAAGAVTRLIDMGIEPFLVASTLLVAIAQRLVRTVCPHCAEAYTPPPEALQSFGIEDTEGFNFMRGRGCFRCNHSGYLGRIGLYEILLIDEFVQDLILRRASSSEIKKAAVKAGLLRTLREDAIRKVKAGRTTLEEAASAVMT